jgi:pantothenate synthetase
MYARKLISNGEKNVSKITTGMKKILNRAASSRIDYVDIVDALNFSLVKNLIHGKKYFVLIACRIGKTRLIDNILIKA